MPWEPQTPYSQTNGERVEGLKKFYSCSTDSELAERLGLKRSQIHAMKRRGFPANAQRIIDDLLAAIND